MKGHQSKLPLPANSVNSLFVEQSIRQSGYLRVAGIDEAGRGCIAGPVVAAAVVIDWSDSFVGLRDSKKLTAKQRDRFFDLIIKNAHAYAVGMVDAAEIDRINILQAALKAMQQAVHQLQPRPDYLLIDGRDKIAVDLPQKAIPRGDDLCFSISAASVLAKVTRDRLMVEYQKEFPQFRFHQHKGYGTKLHWEELKTAGATVLHRKSFRGVLSS